MKVSVDWDRCKSHGRCAQTAPAVFTLGDDGMLSFVEHPDEEHRAAVEAAESGCPEQSITVEG